MPMLVTGDKLSSIIPGWEGVGLASYLLIHFCAADSTCMHAGWR